MAVEVSNNGQDFSDDGVLFFYEETIQILSLSPSSLSVVGGVTVTIIGTNFFLTYPSILACRFGEVEVPGTYISAEQLTCTAPPQDNPGIFSLEVTVNGVDYSNDGFTVEYRPVVLFHEIDPITGPRRGNTEIAVSGTNFRMDDIIFCHFGSLPASKALVMNDTTILCRSPYNEGVRALMSFGLRVEDIFGTSIESYLQGASGSSVNFTYTYYNDEYIDGVFPKYGPVSGGTVIRVTGSDFLHSPALVCRFQSSCGFDAIVPAAFFSSSLITCLTPPFRSNQNASCVSVFPVEVLVSNNGLDFQSMGKTFHYTREIDLLSLLPSSGPESGGTVVTLSGRFFQKLPGLRCIFAAQEVPALFISSATIQCQAPAFHKAVRIDVRVTLNGQNYESAAGLSFQYTSKPTVYEITPTFGAVSGGTNVTIIGNNFLPSEGLQVWCSFGMIVVRAVVFSPSLAYCLSPPHEDGPVEVELAVVEEGPMLNFSSAESSGAWTSNRVEFNFIPELYVTDVFPISGWITGGSLVTVQGKGFVNYSTAICNFGEGIGIVPAIYMSPSIMSCYSPPAPSPMLVGLSISLNGLDFSNEAQYRYQAQVTISAVNPVRALKVGGSIIEVTGSKFPGYGSIGCRFGDQFHANVTAGRHITSSKVECPAPNGDALSTLEVQSISLKGSRSVNEIQTVEVSALSKAEEVQIIKTSGWGYQHEVSWNFFLKWQLYRYIVLQRFLLPCFLNLPFIMFADRFKEFESIKRFLRLRRKSRASAPW